MVDYGCFKTKLKGERRRSDEDQREIDKDQTGERAEGGEINKQGSFKCCLVLCKSVEICVLRLSYPKIESTVEDL